ncbi:MAG: hypothetical protein KC503_08000 [Myxococcales bacterium]|nr:hypothetical protein [Myxococcales bacterium]
MSKLSMSLCGLALLAGASRAWAHPAPPPLSAAQRAIFNGSAEDNLDKKPCIGTRKRVTLKCRDVRHYVRMNEWWHDVWHPYVKDLGGAYVGVASDQAFTFVAWAKSKLAFLMDYDPVVVWINHAHRAFVLESPDIAGYVKLWGRRGRKAGEAVLAKYYKGKHKDYRRIVSAYRRFRGEIGGHFGQVLRRKGRRFHWLHDQGDYEYVRGMFKNGRVRILKGDLLKDKTLRGIGAVSHKLKVPVRIVYTSNAEEFWPYPKDFRLNFAALYMDQKSVILRTRHSSKYGPRIGSYVYIVQDGQDFAKKLNSGWRWKGVWSMLRDRKATHRPGLFVIGPVEQGFQPPRKRKARRRARR